MSIQTIKEFFSTPEKPVENHELLVLKREDPEGFAELSELTEKALAEKEE